MAYRPILPSNRSYRIKRPQRVHIRWTEHKPKGWRHPYIRLNPAACEAIGIVANEINPLVILWDADRYRIGVLCSDDPSWEANKRPIKCSKGNGLRASIARFVHDALLAPELITGTYDLQWDAVERIHYIDLSHIQASQRYRDRLRLVRENGSVAV